MTFTEKVVYFGQQAGYVSLILGGIGVFGVVGYFLFDELTRSDTTHSFYNQVINQAKSDPDVQKILGPKITGEGWRRGGIPQYRSEHEYAKLPLLLIHCALKTSNGLVAPVVAEFIQTKEGVWEYHYLYVEVPEGIEVNGEFGKKVKLANVKHGKSGVVSKVPRIYVVDNRNLYLPKQRRKPNYKNSWFHRGDRRDRLREASA